jgi:hypothetical protein
LRYISQEEELAKEATEACFQIDHLHDEAWPLSRTMAGHRRFLETKEKAHSDARVKVVKTFAHALHARLRGLPEDGRLEPPAQ